MEIDSRVVLVTGGTSGIGRATALAFARRGCRVVVSGRDEARGNEVVAACRALGTDALFVRADVCRADDIEALVSGIVERFGRLDVAFNNAGYQERRAPLLDQPEEAYDAAFDTNVRSLVRSMQAEIRAMLAQPHGGALRHGSGQSRVESRGVIINTASVSGVRNPNPGFALYSASKAAAISLTRSAALEYAPHGIRINAVSPGRIVTPMMLGSQVDIGMVTAGLPLRRMGHVEEVAEAVMWLASDAASFVVGHNLCVDGGFLSA